MSVQKKRWVFSVDSKEEGAEECLTHREEESATSQI